MSKKQPVSYVRVIPDTPEDGTPKYVTVAIEPEAKSAPRPHTGEVLKDTELRQEMLQTALSEFDAMRQRYERFHELAEVFEAVGSAAKKINSVNNNDSAPFR